MKNNSKKQVVGSYSKVVDSKKNEIEANPSKNRDIKRGCIAFQYPDKRTMIMKDSGEVERDEEYDNEELSHDEDLLVVKRVPNMKVKEKDEA
ncbi:hypothetical protein CR513_12624, partial [Mucuna pruriens]